MRLLTKLFGKRSPKPITGNEQAVIVHFNYGQKDLEPLFALEDILTNAIVQAAVGEYDGHDIAVDGSDGNLYMYGPNADKIYSVIQPFLISPSFTKDAKVTLRYGPPVNGVKEVVINVSDTTIIDKEP